MSDSAAHIAREAKGLYQSLKELLKTHNPWDKEVEFSRKNLRRQHLRLLLVEPYAKESKDAETHLWMQTSYQFISHYKQSLATLDRTLQSAPRHQSRHGGHGPVEYRKLMQRFRQFLSDEEKFWTQFIVRYQRSFALHEAYPVLVSLNIATPSDDANLPNLSDASGRNGASHQNHARNHLFFPPEESTPAPVPAEHESRLAILSKAVVCLGDIARYRELYNEAGGRPKAGHEDGTAPARRGGRSSRGGIPGVDSIPRARNYDKAIQCYEQARLLVPYEGNSSHQLAVLAFYQSDMFNSLFHYYRALCVRQPYDTASENVKKILNKALDQQSKKMKDSHTTMSESADVSPRLRVECLKENVVLLHALWRQSSDKIEMDTHANNVITGFQSLVSERNLPTEMVSKVVVLSHGALWKHRMIRNTSSPSNRRSSELPDSSVIESQILTHIITIHRVLLEIGAAELTEPPEDAAANDLAQRITAPFRRTLPALRIATKWLMANIRYILHAAQPPVGGHHSPTGKGTRRVSIEGLPLFWAKFAQFYSTLGGIFPLERLPPLTTPLDEDIELNGFLPLRNLLVDGGLSVPGTDREGRQNRTPFYVREKVHPNEEQLMRIWDLLKDAQTLVQSGTCPIYLGGNTFSFANGASTTPSEIALGLAFQVANQTNHVTENVSPAENGLEDDATTDTSRTDDDPVRDAFQTVLDDPGGADGEDDEDVILYNPRPLGSPPVSVTLVLPSTPALQGTIQLGESPVVAKVHNPITSGHTTTSGLPIIVPGTTAQDLLNTVMGAKRGSVDVTRPPHHKASNAAPQFPFGLGPNAPPSIWSTSLDQGSSASLNSPSLSLRSDVNVGQTFSFSSPKLRHAWSPQLESSQPNRPLLTKQQAHTPQYQPSQPLSAVGPSYRQSATLPLGTSQYVPQLNLDAPYNLTSSMAQPTERRQPQWSKAYSSSLVDPAAVSFMSSSQPTPRGHDYRDFSNGFMQQYVPAGQHQKDPSTSHMWGIHG